MRNLTCSVIRLDSDFEQTCPVTKKTEKEEVSDFWSSIPHIPILRIRRSIFFPSPKSKKIIIIAFFFSFSIFPDLFFCRMSVLCITWLRCPILFVFPSSYSPLIVSSGSSFNLGLIVSSSSSFNLGFVGFSLCVLVRIWLEVLIRVDWGFL